MTPAQKDVRIPPSVRLAVQQLEDVVVLHTRFNTALEAAALTVMQMVDLRMPSGVLLMADAGMGKTLLMSLLQRQLLAQNSFLAGERPVLSVSLDSIVDVHKLAAKVFSAVGYPMLPSRSNLETITEMIDRAIERLQPLALLIDEGQHLCEGNRDLTARTATDWLKVRMDRNRLPIVICGTKSLERIEAINPQFVSRASVHQVIEAIEYGREWHQLMGSFVSGVSACDLSVLGETSVSRKVNQASGGNMRRLKKLLISSCICTSSSEANKVTTEHLSKGYEGAFGHAYGAPNPFRTG
jgi:hypothetical protein